MAARLNIAFFGSSLVSAYWNGAATYYRGLIRAMHQRGHRITFYESDAFDRQKHRDLDDVPWATDVVYRADSRDDLMQCLERARSADVIIKASGNGVFDEQLETEVARMKTPRNIVAFWDVDAPATLERLHRNPSDPFLPLIGQYDFIFTYGGGMRVRRAYEQLGARVCVPIYNALDCSTHFRVPPDARFTADLAFLGNRLPDRESRVEEFFLKPAELLASWKFLLGGSGWADKSLPSNVRYAGHVYTRDHNAFNCTPLAVLNINRQSMAEYGFSPATRIFEAAGAGACIITDDFAGVEEFFEPGQEILVARTGEEVAETLEQLTPQRAGEIGAAAGKRVLAAHTYDQRAELLEQVLGGINPKSEIRNSKQIQNLKSKIQNAPPGPRLQIVIIGLSITSSWGNGHATTYRALVRELVRRGHEVLFLEHDKPWYAGHRDMPSPPFGRCELYKSVGDLRRRFETEIRRADAVIVGSYVPQGVVVGQWVNKIAGGLTAFYDIDTPVTLAKLARGDVEYLSHELIGQYQLYLSFTGGPILNYLEQHLGARRAVPLYCSVDPELYYPESQHDLSNFKFEISNSPCSNPAPAYRERGRAPTDPNAVALGYLGTYSADRQPSLEQLLLEPARQRPRARFVVAGPMYPDEINWPGNVRRIEHLEPARHRAFYNQQKFTLNVTRADMIRAGYCPSVRLFEAAACGVPILSDQWPGLETFFVPGKEIVICRDSIDVLGWLDQEDDRGARQIGQAARTKVLAHHTAGHRAAQLEQYIFEMLGGDSKAASMRSGARAAVMS